MRSRRNWVVATLALLAGGLVFVGNLWLVRQIQPQVMRVLAASRPLQAGDVLTEDALRTIQVYADERAPLYIREEEKEQFLGGYVVRAFASGEPLLREAILAAGSVESRLASILAPFPRHVLFPIPLDVSNVVAGNPFDYRPGDLVGIAVTFVDRPPEPASPPVFTEGIFWTPGLGTPKETTSSETMRVFPSPTPTPQTSPYLERAKPPVTKVLRQAVRVVWAPSPPEAYLPNDGSASQPFSEVSGGWLDEERPVLWVLLPEEDVELLTLGLSSGRVFLYLTWKNPEPGKPGGFSYWDFEALLRAERAKQMEP